jgi:hypothetical protein
MGPGHKEPLTRIRFPKRFTPAFPTRLRWWARRLAAQPAEQVQALGTAVHVVHRDVGEDEATGDLEAQRGLQRIADFAGLASRVPLAPW